MSAFGLICAAGSALFNGSFAALFKTEEMTALSIHPMVFQLYVSAGLFLSSWLVVPFLRYNPAVAVGGDGAAAAAAAVGDEFRFSPPGLAGGFLFVLAVSASFNAVDEIGIALAQGIWGGSAMIVSYLWGALIFGEVPSMLGWSVLGLAMLVVGVVFIAFCEGISKRAIKRYRRATDTTVSIPLVGGQGQEVSVETYLRDARDDPEDVADAGEEEAASHARGVLWACSVGLTGGSILAPLHYVPPEQQGLIFLPSFGIGSMLTSPVVFKVYTTCTGATPPLHARKALGTGLLSGLLWNVGNLLSVVAIPRIGYGVAYPIFQCAILVSGMWGIYAFREITERSTICVFWLGGAILLLGAYLLAVSQ